jgi:uracil-DNA glycosylase
MYRVPRYWRDLFERNENQLSSIFSRIEDYVPEIEDVFYAYELIRPEEVKVVIIGQDPYIGYYSDGVSIANGMAFATDRDRRVQESLKNIYTELYESIPNFIIPTHGDLSCWEENQGVFLLNSALTTSSHKSGVHDKLWEPFIKDTIKELHYFSQDIIYVLLGSKAKRFEDYIRSVSSQNVILSTSHPARHSFNKGFYGSNIFANVNEILEDRYRTDRSQKPIDWNVY